ncbi:MAG: response regulator transcription factor [Candidatus Poribacteria bacterium]
MSKILLVDDDLDFVESTKAVLESGASYQVTCAYDGEEALERIKEEKPDLIILDIMMPKKHGYTLCEELKSDAEYSDIPILLLTAVGSKMSRSRYTAQMGLMTKADDYIDKPVKPEELLNRVKHLLETRS